MALDEKPQALLSLSDARSTAAKLRATRFPPTWTPFQPTGPVASVVEESCTVAEVLPLVNWTYFFQVQRPAFASVGQPLLC